MPDISILRFRGGICAVWYEDGKRKRHQLKARTRKAAEAEALDVYRQNTAIVYLINPRGEPISNSTR